MTLNTPETNKTNYNNKTSNLLQWVFGGFGLVAAIGFMYFLGRLFLNAYYGYFGIPPGALLFSRDEYIFNSYQVAAMLIGAIYWIWIIYECLKRGRYWIIDFTKPLKKQKENIAAEFLMLLFIGAGTYFFYVAIVKINMHATIFPQIIMGVAVIGLIRHIFLLFMWGIFDNKNTTPEQIAASVNFRITYIIVIVLITLIPLTNIIAEKSAISEYENSPSVTIVADNLPLELRSALSEESTSSKVKMLVINNDIAYIFVPSSSQNATNIEHVIKGKVFGIKLSDIKNLTFTK